jgi:hypothetical protein
VTTIDGRLLLVSVMTNNHTVPNRFVDRAQDAILEAVASLDLRAP